MINELLNLKLTIGVDVIAIALFVDVLLTWLYHRWVNASLLEENCNLRSELEWSKRKRRTQ